MPIANAGGAHSAGRPASTRRSALTDPDATMATNGPQPAPRAELQAARRGRRSSFGVVLDVEVTTGEINEGQELLDARSMPPHETTGVAIKVATGGCRLRLRQGLRRCSRSGAEIDAIIPTKAEPIRSKVPLRRFQLRCQA